MRKMNLRMQTLDRDQRTLQKSYQKIIQLIAIHADDKIEQVKKRIYIHREKYLKSMEVRRV